MKLVEGYTLREVIDLSIKKAPRRSTATASTAWSRSSRSRTLTAQPRRRPSRREAREHPDGPFGEVLLLDWGLAKVWSEAPEETPEMPLPAGRIVPYVEEPLRGPICRRSRSSGAATSTTAPTSTRSARCSTRSSPARRRSSDRVAGVLGQVETTPPSEVAPDRDIPQARGHLHAVHREGPDSGSSPRASSRPCSQQLRWSSGALGVHRSRLATGQAPALSARRHEACGGRAAPTGISGSSSPCPTGAHPSRTRPRSPGTRRRARCPRVTDPPRRHRRDRLLDPSFGIASVSGVRMIGQTALTVIHASRRPGRGPS